MGKVLVVPRKEYETSVQVFGPVTRQNKIVIFWYDPNCRDIGPSDKIGQAYGAEALFISLSPETVDIIAGRYQMVLEGDGIFRKGVQAFRQEIGSWSNPNPVNPPSPSFSEIAAEIQSAHKKSLKYTEEALRLADRVATSADDSAETFRDFFRSSLQALVAVSEATKELTGDLAGFFAEHAPLATFATSGQEMIKFTGLDDRVVSTAMHFKPSRERTGFTYAREKKPRLYFKYIKIDGNKVAVVCYFGPHPQERSSKNTGKIVMD